MYCLRSIKESIQDPHNHFKHSWDFSNREEGFFCNFVGVHCEMPDSAVERRISNIDLRSKELKGNFPREIKNCSFLTHLDLSGNELSGTIPSDIFDFLPSLKFLDLSSNNFTGEIPKSVVNCHSLNVLRLDNNRLTGLIPPKINELRSLDKFSVANNLLSGPVPVFSCHKIPSESYANNLGLCGAPLEPCLPSTKKFIVLFKEGFVVGWSIAMVSVAVVMFRNTLRFLMKKATTKKNKKIKKAVIGAGGARWCFTDERSRNMMMSQMERTVIRMSFTEISQATGNFNIHKVIGLGKIGMMYKAMIPNCWPLAVKRLTNCQSHETQFLSELSALGILRHDNLVPLLGYCSEQNEKLLVYKYILHGNLYDWLHVGEGEHKDKILEWPLRTKIAIGIARGLSWLHHKTADGNALRIACTCLNPFPSQRPTMLELYNTISTFGERDGITNDSEILMQLEIAIASSSIEINTLSTFGEKYDITNDSEILMQSEIAIASSSNEIVELEIAQTN
nr:putative inactive leucine-rich repeat receptor-like protein kinase [Quercus suber]